VIVFLVKSKYKRKPGPPRIQYATNYSADHMDCALRRIARGDSMLKASKKYNILYGTLYNKVNHLHTKKVFLYWSRLVWLECLNDRGIR